MFKFVLIKVCCESARERKLAIYTCLDNLDIECDILGVMKGFGQTGCVQRRSRTEGANVMQWECLTRTNMCVSLSLSLSLSLSARYHVLQR